MNFKRPWALNREITIILEHGRLTSKVNWSRVGYFHHVFLRSSYSGWSVTVYHSTPYSARMSPENTHKPTPYSARMSPENTHKLMGFNMEVLILGVIL